MRRVVLIAAFLIGFWTHLALAENSQRLLTLPEALQEARRSHENIRVAQLQWELSSITPARAVSSVLPHFSSAANFAVNKKGLLLDPASAADLGVPPDVSSKTQWKGEFTLSQPLKPEAFPGYVAGLQLEISDKESYWFTLRQVLFSVTRAYFDVLKQERLVEVSEENLKLAKEQADVAQKRLDAGEVPRTDYLRSAVEVTRADRNRLDTLNRRDLARARLKNLLGWPQEVDITVEEPAALANPAPSLEEARKIALDHRNDLQRQLCLTDQAAWELRRAYAKFIPTFELEFKEVLVDPESFADRNDFWTLLLKFDSSFLEGTDRFLDVKEKRLRLAQEKLRTERLKKDVLLEVQDAWLAVQTLASTLKVTKEEMDLAQENYQDTTARYRVGEAASVDVSDTFARLVTARTDWTNQTYEYQVALYHLERVLGIFAQEYLQE